MNKHQTIGAMILCLLIIAGISVRKYRTMKMIEAYEAQERSEDKSTPCTFIDEEAGTLEEWNDDDPEFKGLKKDPETGMFLPKKDSSGRIIKDVPAGYPGSKSLHIPMIRGFQDSDYIGQAFCRPCREAKTKLEIEACQDAIGYRNLGTPPEDIDKIVYSDNSKGQ